MTRKEEIVAHGEVLTSKKGKTDYGVQNKQGIQPRYGKSKGEPDNGPKSHQMNMCKDEYDRYGDGKS